MERTCPSCKLNNRPERRFCGGCGTSLGRLCSFCGFFNETGDVFCGGCGQGVGDAIGSEPLATSSTANVATPTTPPPAASPPKPTPSNDPFDIQSLQDEAAQFREEMEKQDHLDQGDIDALFNDAS